MKFTNCVTLVGSKPKRYEGTKRYVSTGALAVDHIDEESVELVGYEDRPSRADLTAESGDVLFAKMADTKKTILLDKETAENIYSTGFFAVRAKQGMITAECLYYLLTSDVFLRQKNKHSSGATQRAITNKGLEAIAISIPNLDEQTRLVAKLAALSRVIKSREQQLVELDNLIKARFVELFGDPVTNSMGWETKTIKELASKIGSGATPKGGRESYGTEGISLIRSMNVYNGRFEHKDLAHISDEQAEKLDNVTIEKDDVLLNITGASVARCCVVPEDVIPARVNQHVCIIRCKDWISPEFMCNVLTDGNYQKHLWRIAGSGATREAITKQQVEMLSIIMPPTELQQQFSDFCRQVDKSKVVVQKALEEAQLLFDSLMQEYFG